jgi:hypothetical protein
MPKNTDIYPTKIYPFSDTSASEEEEEAEEMSVEADDSLRREEPELEQAFAFDGMNFSRFDGEFFLGKLGI